MRLAATIFKESSSAKASKRRPVLEAALASLEEGDTLVVWRLDRLGRSLKHLMDVMTDLESRGVVFESLHETIDTSHAMGRLIFHVFGAVAEFEREVTVERTKVGLAAARASGAKPGRKYVLTPEQESAVRERYGEGGQTITALGREFGVSRATIHRTLTRSR